MSHFARGPVENVTFGGRSAFGSGRAWGPGTALVQAEQDLGTVFGLANAVAVGGNARVRNFAGAYARHSTVFGFAYAYGATSVAQVDHGRNGYSYGGLVAGYAFSQAAGPARVYGTYGGNVLGMAWAFAGGDAEVRSVGSGSLATGFAQNNAASFTARVGADAFGATAHGWADNGPVGQGAYVRANNLGAFAHGLSRTVVAAPANLIANGIGSFAAGYCRNNGTIDAAGQGSFAQGIASSAASTAVSNIGASANGAFAQGAALTNAGFTAAIYASAEGAFAQGRAFGQTGTANIYGSGIGSFAQGFALNGLIAAYGTGSFAQGYTNTGLADIVANATNAAQFGPGTNALADSVQIGSAGLRLRGTTSFATPQNGDIGVDGSGNVLMRSAGATQTFNQPTIAGSRGGNAALAALLTGLANMGLIVDNTTA